MVTMRRLIVGCLPALLFACALDEDEEERAPIPTLHARLHTGARLYTSNGAFTMTGSALSGREVQENVAVRDGELALMIERDQLALTEWQLDVGDVRILMGDGRIYLTDVTLKLANAVPLDGCWRTALDDVVATGTMSVVLEGRFVSTHGRRIALPAHRVDDVQFEARVTSNAGQLDAVVAIRRDGVFWERHGALSLSDAQGSMMASDSDVSAEP
jgi:hypothetical protein